MELEVDRQPDDSDFEAVELFREEVLSHFGGADVVANMLQIPGGADLHDADADHVHALSRIIGTLADLCGDRQKAFQWLLSNPNYHAIAGSEPYLALEYGGFWSMSMLLDWLLIIARYRPTKIMSEVFRFPDRLI